MGDGDALMHLTTPRSFGLNILPVNQLLDNAKRATYVADGNIVS